jgi:hypothetical protein
MTPLERLFSLEVDFHRLLRNAASSSHDRSSLHTSFALQNGYEQLLYAARGATATHVDALTLGYHSRGDSRDVIAARDSLNQLLGLSIMEP